MKFGGVSLGDGDRMRNVIDIIAERRDHRPVIVVSALPGVTSDLLDASAAARTQNLTRVHEILAAIRVRHEDIAMRLVQQKFDFFEFFIRRLCKEIDQAEIILQGITLLGEITLRGRDKVTSLGERLSSVLCTYAMMMGELPAEHVESEDVIWSNDHYGDATPDMDMTGEAAHRVLVPILERNYIPVMGGLIARTVDGAITTLGPNGADYSATIVGAAIRATEVQIWTDFDGLLTCDPRLVPGARVIEELSFREAAEFTFFGAKLNPRTLQPAAAAGIPVRVLNTLNPSATGTLITRSGAQPRTGPRFISGTRNVTLVHVTGRQAIDQSMFLAQVFSAFAELKIVVDLVATSERAVTATIAHMTEKERLVQRLLYIDADAELIERQSIVSIVGQDLFSDARLRTRVLESLRGVPVKMVSLGRSGLSLSLVVDEVDADDAVRWIHHALFETD